MRAMRRSACGFLLLLASALALSAEREPLTETDFRGTLGVAEHVKLSYRGLDCNPMSPIFRRDTYEARQSFRSDMFEPN